MSQIRNETNGRFVATHGDWAGNKASRIYTCWQSMKARCFYSKHPRFNYYGGKGITVCAEWMDFQEYKKWSLENGYNDTMTMDRIDSDKNYEPSNCRWISKSENSKKSCMKTAKTVREKLNVKYHEIATVVSVVRMFRGRITVTTKTTSTSSTGSNRAVSWCAINGRLRP